MKKISLFLIAIAMCVAMVSCNDNDVVKEEMEEVPSSIYDLRIPVKPMKLSSKQQTMMNENNVFALRFLDEVNKMEKAEKSFFFSPLSLTYLFGMANNAGDDNAHDWIEKLLGFSEGGLDELNAYCETLITQLPEVDPQVKFGIANAFFANKGVGYSLNQTFVETLQNHYKATVDQLDFSAPKSLTTINNWCSEKTEGLVPKMFEELDKSALAMFINALYFQGEWSSKFNKKNTKKADFFSPQGKVKVNMMSQKALASCGETDVFDYLNLPYGNGLWGIQILMPKQGKTIGDVITSMRETGADKVLWSNAFSEVAEVEIKLPRFETSSTTDELGEHGLKELIQKMTGRFFLDNFSGMYADYASDDAIELAMMLQKAKISVDETGAKAAVVSVAEAMCGSAGEREYEERKFTADHPFIYVIREISSGAIVFVGKFTGK